MQYFIINGRYYKTSDLGVALNKYAKYYYKNTPAMEVLSIGAMRITKTQYERDLGITKED